MSKLPLVSFVIPTHNRADVLKECLESVVNQTYKDIEVIVINDNSEDETLSILEEYKNNYTNFKYYNNNGIGGNAARNFGMQKASGDYIALLDDDDICEPDRIEKQMQPVLDSSFEYNFIISGYYSFNSTNDRIKSITFLKPKDSVGFPSRWLIKKSLITENNEFDVNQPALQDIDFFLRIKDKCNFYFTKEPVVRIRNSRISVSRNHERMIYAVNRLIKKHCVAMGKYEIKSWILTLFLSYASLMKWNEYKNELKNYRIKIHFIFKVFLILTLFTKEKKILLLYSLYLDKFNKLLYQLNIISPSFKYTT